MPNRAAENEIRINGEKKPLAVFTDAATVSQDDISFAPLEAVCDLVRYPMTGREELAGRIADAEILLCNKTKITAADMDGAKKLKLIALFATGYNNIDTAAARERGITVCNAGEYSTNAVAQHTFALLLELCSRVGDYSRFTADGGWKSSSLFSVFRYPSAEIYGKTFGIVGLGSIGRAVAKIANAFGMKVIAYTRTPKEVENVKLVSFDELLTHSDVISVHCPLTDATKEMFSEAEFAKMKRTALFINTSRGGVVCEKALADALGNNLIKGAALDVLTDEPQRSDCPLAADGSRLIITPHVAWTPTETRERLMDIVADNVASFLAGAPENKVN